MLRDKRVSILLCCIVSPVIPIHSETFRLKNFDIIDNFYFFDQFKYLMYVKFQQINYPYSKSSKRIT